MIKFFDRNQFLVGLGTVCVISFLTSLPLFHDGFFPIHDDAQIVRVQQMTKALQDGQFPVRWVSDLGYGYGYPIFNFYAPLPYYIGSLFDLIGFTPLAATKMMMGIGLLLAGVAMYVLSEKIWGTWGAVISAVLYQFAPYHAVQLYVRGSVGELYAYAFLPLVMVGLYKVFTDKTNFLKGLVIASVSFAALILSHNISAMITFVYIVITLFVFMNAVRIKGIVERETDMKGLGQVYIILLFIILSLGLSAFYWLPALVEKDYTSVDQIITTGGSDFHLHFLYPDQLWDSPWGFAGSAPGRDDGMSFKIGKLHMLFGLVGLIGAIWSIVRNKKKWMDGLVGIGFGIALLIFSVYMTVENSVSVWEAGGPFLSYIQFPWRFLVFILFFISLYAGGIVAVDKNKIRTLAVTAIILMSIVYVNLKYFNPQAYYQISQNEYEGDLYVKWHTSRISDEYLPRAIDRPDNEYEIVYSKFDLESGVVENQVIKTDEQSATIRVDQLTQLVINTAYFPGWHVYIDDQEVLPIIAGGKMEISVPEGQHVVRLLFTNTAVRSLANTISGIGGVILFGTMMLLRKSRLTR
ncbi:MAG: 6-pyruvoyl-tetrahydropterin synthase-related protein [Candidatus Roizmanbacteria bacterium]|nr:6-pyruvoyl-tetrahydropterin synthase-related protein [Candidatus Roizmanbacteria bacterium]